MNIANYSLSKLRFDLMDMGEFCKPEEEEAVKVLNDWNNGLRSEREAVKKLVKLGIIENGA